MRFLLLTQYFPPEIGGPQTRLQSMAEELLRRGHEVEVVTARPNYPRGKFFDSCGGRLYVRELRNGVTVHRLWLYPAMGSGIGRMLNYATFTATCLIGLLRSRKPDYLFVESPPLTTSIPAYFAKLLWGVPVIFNVADLWPDAIVDNGFLKEGIILKLFLALEKWSYRRATYVNAVTEGIRDALIERKRLPREKILFLPNGVDTVRYQQREPDLRLKEQLGLAGKKIILWAGTQGYAHGLEFVLLAAKLLLPHAELHFLFLGDGSSRKQLEQTKEDLGLSNVTFRDPVPIEELPPYYSIAECGLASLRRLPVHEGARPSKIFPVLASGKPLIYVGGGECARLIETSQAGIVVPPENPEALAQHITLLFEQPELIQQLGGNARKFIEQNFDWSQLVGDWILQLSISKPRPAMGPETSTI
ncbi:MAG TPA: glycosyltransferase family 4 protein [Candidatus Acidoferrum sp.]|jgi:colanic acid biosynthesis glycosyl transferase WcaI